MMRFATLACLVLLAGCGGSSGPTEPPPGPTAEELTLDGWEAFEAGEWESADSLFAEALILDGAYRIAVEGRAWSVFRAGDYAAAESFVESALSLKNDAVDALAAGVFTAAAMDSQAVVLERGLLLVESEPFYEFDHDTEVGAGDIRWHAAKAALLLHELDLAAAQLDILSPGHGLHPGQADFVSRALELLESIQEGV